jgi:Na+/phosphate symporter
MLRIYCVLIFYNTVTYTLKNINTASMQINDRIFNHYIPNLCQEIIRYLFSNHTAWVFVVVVAGSYFQVQKTKLKLTEARADKSSAVYVSRALYQLVYAAWLVAQCLRDLEGPGQLRLLVFPWGCPPSQLLPAFRKFNHRGPRLLSIVWC